MESDHETVQYRRESYPRCGERLAIPAILAAKSRYFWCIDNQEFDLMPDVFTEEGFQTFWGGRPGLKDRLAQVE